VTTRSRVAEAFDVVRREDFLPPDQQRFARVDRALPIGHGQTNSQPSTVREMLELLDVRPGDRVLDVGCGSGWTTALLGVLVGTTGEVHGVEILPELAAWGRENLSRYAMPWTTITQAAEGVLGLPDRAPYDRVLVSAEASAVPDALVGQLTAGGLMVVPVAGRMTQVRRGEDGEPSVVRGGHYSFVPLHEPEP
jgi:protein-L-isoaspartate(D-aspartate) O-methyltransferase